MKDLDIVTPCNENWDEFTPTQKGAFCGKCQIDVFDFSNKTNEEIKTILRNNIGQHVCGRIPQNKIDELNAEYQVWQNQQTRTFQSKFIYALVLVFGITLFSCSEQEAQTIANISSQQIEMNTDADREVENSKIIPLESIDKRAAENQFQFRLEPLLEIQEIAVYDWEETDMKLINKCIKEQIVSYRTETMTLGGVGSSVHYDNYLVRTLEPIVEAETDENDIVEDNEILGFGNSNVFPNPTAGNSTLRLDVNTFGQFDIGVYSMSGQKVSTIHMGDLDEGRQEFQLDLSDYQTGTYLIVINSGEKSETLKIQKVQ